MRAKEFVIENFADGKKPGRKGLAKRSGVNCKASVTSLRKTAKNSTGEKRRMAHWCANMKSGRNESVEEGWKEAKQLKLYLNSGWVGVENSPEGVLIYAEDIQLGDSKIWISFIHNLTSDKTLETKMSDDYNGNINVDNDDVNYLINDIIDDVKKYYGSTWEEISDELDGGLDIEEGWKDWVAGAALGAAALGANAKPAIVYQYAEPGDTVYSIARQNNINPAEILKLNNLNKDTKLKVGQEVKVPDYSRPVSTKEPVKKIDKVKKVDKKLDTTNTVTGTKHEAILRQYAKKANIKGNELVAFLAQVAHETMDFKHMSEIGGSLDFKKYDIRFAPAKAKQLGNIEPGDGAKYKGRGYIQLTGRYNYKKAGEALGLPLEQKPELVEKPEVAAKVAIWYWKNRVKPNVDDFKDVRGVTKPINPGLKGLEDRKEKYQTYKVALK